MWSAEGDTKRRRLVREAKGVCTTAGRRKGCGLLLGVGRGVDS